MSTIATLRANLLSAIASILPSGTEILEARVPSTSFAVAIRHPAVVVSYSGKPKKEPGPLGNRGKQGYSYVFTIAIVEENWQAPASATYGAADLAELLLGSPELPPATPNLRTTSIGTIAGEDIYLQFVSESLEMDPGATAQGGKFAIVQQWESNQVRV